MSIIYIDGNKGLVQIFEAPDEAVDSHILAEQMLDMFADNEREKQHVSSVSAGRGADHAWIGCLNFSFYDKRRKADAPEAGRPRRHRNRLPRQEAKGAGGQVLGAERQIKQPGRPGNRCRRRG